MKALNRAHVVAHLFVYQLQLGGLRIITKKLQVNVRQLRRRPPPHCAAKVGVELGHALHPHTRQGAQSSERSGLGFGAKGVYVVTHGLFQNIVRWQGRAT